MARLQSSGRHATVPIGFDGRTFGDLRGTAEVAAEVYETEKKADLESGEPLSAEVAAAALDPENADANFALKLTRAIVPETDGPETSHLTNPPGHPSASDVKRAHNLKIPPISMWASQIFGTLGSLFYFGVAWWVMFQKSIELGGGDRQYWHMINIPVIVYIGGAGQHQNYWWLRSLSK
ncbi:hypothetical protein BJ742DRAFT_775403 [Cladochytrium replicatum]|nr:hypothetical protein BJ742DRAFT_775403 [Cladochytrium replicatum]